MIEDSRPTWAPTREPQFWPTSTGGTFARRLSAFTTGFWRRQSPPARKLKSPRPPRRKADRPRHVASPIAHTFGGFWTFLILAAQLKTRLAAQWRQWLPRLGVLMLVANLPDLDFLPVLFNGSAKNLHHSFTHSLIFAILVSLILSSAWRIAPGFWRSTLLYFTAYSSHLLIDFFTGTKIGWTHTGFGMPLFWPWSKEFSSPLILTFGVRHKTFAALFSLDNIWSCTYELLTCGAITAIILVLWKARLNSRNRFTLSEAPVAERRA
ncbi:MAG: hypothetical protein DMF24_01630 [Verrucomicrobia bacterium]|nr:MAG: hypothetical protein DMF24_01630 [Verrucomicrobiota bacterium]